jgi:hypothetical protein
MNRANADLMRRTFWFTTKIRGRHSRNQRKRRTKYVYHRDAEFGVFFNQKLFTPRSPRLCGEISSSLGRGFAAPAPMAAEKSSTPA